MGSQGIEGKGLVADLGKGRAVVVESTQGRAPAAAVEQKEEGMVGMAAAALGTVEEPAGKFEGAAQEQHTLAGEGKVGMVAVVEAAAVEVGSQQLEVALAAAAAMAAPAAAVELGTHPQVAPVLAGAKTGELVAEMALPALPAVAAPEQKG